MLRYLFDSDHLTLFQHGHAPVGRRQRLEGPGAVGICVVTIEESLRGRLAQLARAGDGPKRIQCYAAMKETLLDFAKFTVVDYDQPAENQFQQLRAVRIGTQDKKIAAIARANQLILGTCNRRDFSRVPGLVLEDWSI